MIKRFRGKISKHPFRRKIVRVLTILFLALTFLEFLIYFGSNFFLLNWTRSKINDATGGVYQVDFNRLNFSLIRRGIFLNGVVMKPVEVDSTNSDQVLFDFTLDELAVSNLWYDWSDHIFTIGKISLDNPNLGVQLSEKDTNGPGNRQQVSAVKRLEEEIQKSIRRIPIGGVYIEEIEINHADLLFLNFLSQNSINAENSSLKIRGVDWTSADDWSSPFNAKGFEFDLESVQFELPDQVHTLYADQVWVSSLEKQISIEEFSLVSNRAIPSSTYYDVNLAQLRVGNVDLNRAFMESELEIDEIVLDKPRLQVLKSLNQTSERGKTGDLNELIQGILKSFHVQELSVNHGKFLTASIEDSLKNRIEVEDLGFKMIEFYLGEEEEKRANQFFYGKDASMELGDVSLYLSDGVHLLKGERVMASSFLDEIKVVGFEMLPRDTAIISQSPDQLIRIKLHELEFTEANLKKLYNEGELDVHRLAIESPHVQVVELTKSAGEEEVKNVTTTYLLGYLNEVTIDEFELQNGQVQFTNEAGVRSDDIGFESFGLLLENLRFSPDSTMKIRDILLADEMILSLEKYKLKLRDNLHVFSADNILIDSKRSLIAIDHFSLKPEEENIQTVLDRYDKTVAVDLSVPSFRVEGIDIKEALLEGNLWIHSILVPEPEFSYTRYRPKVGAVGSAQIESTEGIKSILQSYFHQVTIDSVNFDQGKFNFTDYSGRQEISFSEENLSLILKGFSLDESDSAQRRTFFSDEIILNLADYSFSLAKGDYDVTTSNLQFNTKARSLEIDTLRLKAGENLDSKLALGLVLPKVKIEGIDLEDFLFENIIDLEKLSVEGSDIRLDINPKMERKLLQKRSGKSRLRTLDFVKVDEIHALNSDFQMNYIQGEKDVQSLQTSFDVSISDFFMNEQEEGDVELAGLFSKVAIDINDFTFILPDSLHSVKLSSLVYDNSVEETILSDLEIRPLNSLETSPGILLEGKIAEIGIRNNSLDEIESTGIFDLNLLRIKNPELKIYLDSAARPKRKLAKNEKDLKEPFISSLLLHRVQLTEGRVEVLEKNKTPRNGLNFLDFDFAISDLEMDLLAEELELNASELLSYPFNFSLRDYEFFTKDSLELVEIGEVSLENSSVEIRDFSFRPAMGRYAYLRHKGYQTDAIDMRLGRLKIQGIDLQKYFSDQLFQAEKVELEQVHLDVFRDKRLPLPEGVYKPMPQVMMTNSKYQVRIDCVYVSDSRVRYQEFVPGAQMPGRVLFDEMNVSITPFELSGDAAGHSKDTLKMVAETRLMGKGDVKVEAEMYFEPGSPMNVKMELGPMEMKDANDILSKGAFVKATSGKIDTARWSFRLDNEEAIGGMEFLYEGLKVELLDSLTLDKGKGKLSIETFLANTLIKNNNPRKLLGNKVRADVYVKRDQSKFIFNTWWKATFSGLKGSFGLGQPQMPKRKEEE